MATVDRRGGTAGNRRATLRASPRADCLEQTVEDWGKLLGDNAAVSAMLDRLLHHGHVLGCGRAAGEPRPAVPQKANDKTNRNSKNGG